MINNISMIYYPPYTPTNFAYRISVLWHFVLVVKLTVASICKATPGGNPSLSSLLFMSL